MHLILDGAYAGAWPQAHHLPDLPQLHALLSTMLPGPVVDLTADTAPWDLIDTAFERQHALALGWQTAPGTAPWAALEAAQRQLTDAYPATGAPAASDSADHQPPAAWVWLHPCHLQVTRDHARLLPIEDLNLSEAEDLALFEAVATELAHHQWQLTRVATGQWLGRHPMVADLPLVSLARATGRPVEGWLTSQGQGHPHAQALRRTQLTLQMVLHHLPLQTQRAERGQLPINAVWFSGAGHALPTKGSTHLVTDRRLAVCLSQRHTPPAEPGDAFHHAWAQLDQSLLRDLQTAIQSSAAQARLGHNDDVHRLTLCTETRSCTWTWTAQTARGSWARQWRERARACWLKLTSPPGSAKQAGGSTPHLGPAGRQSPSHPAASERVVRALTALEDRT